MERCRRGEACKESGAGEVSSNSLVRVRVNGFEGFRVGKVSIYTRVFFFFFFF